MNAGKYVVWGAECGQIVRRDGNMALVMVSEWNVEVWVRIEELRAA